MAQDTTLNPLIKPTVKVSATDSTEADFGYSSAGVYTAAYSVSVGSVVAQNAQVAVIEFVGTGADNATFECQIWTRVPVASATGAIDKAFFLQPAGLAACTLSTMTGDSASSALPATYRIVDTITWTPATTGTTPAGNFTDLCTAFGAGTGTSSNGANTPATLILPLVGECTELVFDFKLGTATAANAFCQLNVS